MARLSFLQRASDSFLSAGTVNANFCYVEVRFLRR